MNPEIPHSQDGAQRFALVIELRGDRQEEYRELHRGPGVRDLLRQFNIRNFSIYLNEFPDGTLYEFAYYEYVGDAYEADMNALAEHPRNIEWLKKCDAMQIPFPGETGWAMMECIFFNA